MPPLIPAWLLAFLIRVVLPVILADLVKSGFVSAAGAMAVKYGIDFEQFMAKLKTYREYPGNPKPDNKITNFNKREE